MRREVEFVCSFIWPSHLKLNWSTWTLDIVYNNGWSGNPNVNCGLSVWTLSCLRVWICDFWEWRCGGESLWDPLPRNQQQDGENSYSETLFHFRCTATTCAWLTDIFPFHSQVECKKAQPKEVMSPTGSSRGRARVMPYGMDAFMLGIGMLGKSVDYKDD